MATAAIKVPLKDPYSEHIEFSKVSARRGGGMVCGKFNAKNSYGGYLGETRFLYTVSDRMGPDLQVYENGRPAGLQKDYAQDDDAMNHIGQDTKNGMIILMWTSPGAVGIPGL
jgi:hypothetical protein